MTFQSHDSYSRFNRAVRSEFRYARTSEQSNFLRTVVDTAPARTLLMKAGLLLWRAQLGHSWRKIEGSPDGEFGEEFSIQIEAAHPPQRMKPRPEKASDGRANPKGIPCLYMATQKETAVLEVRPLIGSYVSIAQFKLRRNLRLVNCSADEIRNSLFFLKNSWTKEEAEKKVWSDINGAFSKPVERGDDSLDYIPTQIISELFKLNGFDGITYKSSYGEDGLNVALFDVNAADLINCQLYTVKDVSVVLDERDDPYFIK